MKSYIVSGAYPVYFTETGTRSEILPVVYVNETTSSVYNLDIFVFGAALQWAAIFFVSVGSFIT